MIEVVLSTPNKGEAKAQSGAGTELRLHRMGVSPQHVGGALIAGASYARASYANLWERNRSTLLNERVPPRLRLLCPTEGVRIETVGFPALHVPVVNVAAVTKAKPS